MRERGSRALDALVYPSEEELTFEGRDPVEQSEAEQDGNLTRTSGTDGLLLLQRDLALELAGPIDETSAFQAILHAALAATGMEAGGIYLRDDGAKRFVLACHVGFSAPFVAEVRHVPDSNPWAAMVASGQSLFLPIAEASHLPEQDALQREGLRSLAVVPLLHESKPIASLNIASRSMVEVPADARLALGTIAAQIGPVFARLRQESDLRESEARFRAIAVGVNDAIAVLDSRGRAVFVNRAALALTGHPECDLLGEEFMSRFVGPDRLDEERERVRLCFSSLAAFGDRPVDTVAIHASGRDIPIEMSWSRVPIGGAPHLLFVLRDVSERMATEQALLAARDELAALVQEGVRELEEKGNLLSGVAHEINNPVHFLLLNAEFALRAFDSFREVLDERVSSQGDFPVAGTTYLAVRDQLPGIFRGLLGGATRIRHIIAQLKAFARDGTGGCKTHVDVNGTVRGVAQQLQLAIAKVTDRFSLHLAPDLPEVLGDGSRLETVAANFIHNACQALTQRDQSIAVHTRLDCDGAAVVLEVIDEGEGIAPEVLPRVMNPFFTTRRSTGGAGLGLALAARIAKDHGGRIEIASERGKGTTVRLLVPCLAAQLSDPSPSIPD